MPRYNHAQLPLIRLRSRIGARYVVHTDIANFYHSIYTHSIPWALHSKPTAKVNRKSTLLGNRLDLLARNQQDGQTIGVAIGPDTSLLLAECVLRGVDDIVSEKLPRHVGFRHVDDYEISCSTLAEAEQSLAAIEGGLAEFQLLLNPKKTRIEELPTPVESAWLKELGDFEFSGGSPARERRDLTTYFSKAYELAVQHSDDAVLKYAITRLRGVKLVSSQAWQIVQAALLLCVQSDPTCLPVAFDILARHVSSGRRVKKSAIARTLAGILTRHAPVGHGSEVAWALWGAIAFDINLELENIVLSAIANLEDDFVALLALDAEARGTLSAKLDRQNWTGLVCDEQLSSDHWLLAYEADAQGWMPRSPTLSTPIVSAFRALKANGVLFYDQAKNSPIVPGAALPIPGGAIGTFYL